MRTVPANNKCLCNIKIELNLLRAVFIASYFTASINVLQRGDIPQVYLNNRLKCGLFVVSRSSSLLFYHYLLCLDTMDTLFYSTHRFCVSALWFSWRVENPDGFRVELQSAVGVSDCKYFYWKKEFIIFLLYVCASLCIEGHHAEVLDLFFQMFSVGGVV